MVLKRCCMWWNGSLPTWMMYCMGGMVLHDGLEIGIVHWHCVCLCPWAAYMLSCYLLLGFFFSVCDGIWFVFSFTYSIDLARGWEHIVLDTTFDESVSLKLLLEWTRRNTPKLYFYGILCYFYGNDGKSLILQTTDDRTQLKMIIWELELKQSLWIFFKIFTESLNLGQFFYRASTYCLHVAMKHGTLIYFKLP